MESLIDLYLKFVFRRSPNTPPQLVEEDIQQAYEDEKRYEIDMLEEEEKEYYNDMFNL